MYIDLLKLKAYKLFENSDADLFKEANLFCDLGSKLPGRLSHLDDLNRDLSDGYVAKC